MKDSPNFIHEAEEIQTGIDGVGKTDHLIIVSMRQGQVK